MIFKAEALFKNQENMMLSITRIGIPNHTHRIEMKPPLRGEERKRVVEKVRAEGVSNVRNQLLAQNQNVPSKQHKF